MAYNSDRDWGHAVVTPGRGYTGGLNYNRGGPPTVQAPTPAQTTRWTGTNTGATNIQGLLDMQRQDNLWARNKNQESWDLARNTLFNTQNAWNQNPVANANRQRAMMLLANPEAINDQTQSFIRNQAYNQIGSDANAAMARSAGALSAGGQADAATLAAMQENINNQAMAQKQSVVTDLEVRRANQRNQDILNAMNAGGQVAGQDQQQQQWLAGTLIGNLPQYKADDYSGYVAAILGDQRQRENQDLLKGLYGHGQGSYADPGPARTVFRMNGNGEVGDPNWMWNQPGLGAAAGAQYGGVGWTAQSTSSNPLPGLGDTQMGFNGAPTYRQQLMMAAFGAPRVNRTNNYDNRSTVNNYSGV